MYATPAPTLHACACAQQSGSGRSVVAFHCLHTPIAIAQDAVHRGDLELVKQAVDSGADPDDPDVRSTYAMRVCQASSL